MPMIIKRSSSGATSIAGLSDVDVTTVAPSENHVLTYTGGKWRPRTGTGTGSGSGSGGSGAAYIVNLATWGIVLGLPVKPYVTADYTKADNNCKGINNALQYAYDNNYNYVLFPRGDYSLCYRDDGSGNNNSIVTRANMTIDFNYSTFKVMYDSDVRQPYDTRPSNPPLVDFSGIVITCKTPNTHIMNLNLIGDRIDRSWVDINEKSRENTTGIFIGTGADKCNVRFCNFSYFMADAISIGFGGYSSFSIGQLEFGGIDENGALITGATAKTVRTIAPITLPTGIQSFTMIGLGYAPSTTIPSGMYDVSFYKSDNTFISKRTNVRTRDRVAIPEGADKIKLVWEGDGSLDGGTTWPDNPPYWVLLLQKGLSDDVVIEHNEIHRNHRGGLLIGTNNVTARHNYFHDNAVPENTDIDGLPTFTDFTRYSISTEDNVGHNCKIIDNVFDKTRMAIAIRGEFNEISGNEFRSCTFGIILYYQKHIAVSKNYFHYAGFVGFDFNNFDRDWIITDNIFIGDSTVNFPGVGGSVANFSNNSFYNGATFNSPVPVLNFRNNSFKNSTYVASNGGNTSLEDCSFIDNSLLSLVGTTTPSFEIRRSKFINSFVRNGSGSRVTIRNSDLKESGFLWYGTNVTFSFINCDIKNTLKSLVENPSMMDVGKVYHNLELLNCRVSIGRNPLVAAFFWKDLLIQDTPIKFTVATPFSRALHDGYGNILGKVRIINSPITADNAAVSHPIEETPNIYVDTKSVFTNFSLTNAIVQIQSDKMSTEPTSGTYAVSDQVLHAVPVAGGFLGWVCVTAGTANSTPWQASTPKVVGQQIYSGTTVYEVTVSGATGSSEPTFPTTSGSTVVDGTVTWKELGVKAAFKTFGAIV